MHLYVVAGTTLYQATTTPTATSLGTIAGSDIVRMSVNGDNLVIVATNRAYVWNGVSLTEITSSMPSTPRDVTFLDQYSLFVGAGGRFFISDLADPTAYTATNIATAEGDTDDLVSCIADHQELWLLGESSIEVWYNTGSPDFPFERIRGAVIERGCAARDSVLAEDGAVFWLGDDRRIYRGQGYTPARISTPGVEQALEGYSTLSDAHAMIQRYGAHKFYVLTFPTEDKTWGYDLTTGLWHERESRRNTTTTGRWRGVGYAEFDGYHLVGDPFTGQIWRLDADTFMDAGVEQVAEAVSPPVHAQRQRLTLHSFEVDIESGVGSVTGQGKTPEVMLAVSDDGGKTWGTERTRSYGVGGAYTTRVKFWRLGQARERVVRIRISDPAMRALYDSYALIEAEEAG
jgi:hypothetical protein